MKHADLSPDIPAGTGQPVTIHRTARSCDIDEHGHVNNAVYLVWAQDIATFHWNQAGSPDIREKYIWIVLRHEIDYREPVLEGESVRIRTWTGRFSGPRFERHTDIRKAGAERFCARVKTVWCLLDAQTRKPRRINTVIAGLFGIADGQPDTLRYPDR